MDMMEESILNSVKMELSGIEPDNTDFDRDLIPHINTVLAILYQLGVGKKNFRITSSSETWGDFLNEEQEEDSLTMCPTYVALKVKRFWDPPQSGAASEALKAMIDELEFRLNIQVDPGNFE